MGGLQTCFAATTHAWVVVRDVYWVMASPGSECVRVRVRVMVRVRVRVLIIYR